MAERPPRSSAAPGSYAPALSRSSQPLPAAALDESAVAEFLVSKKYHLAALELHQELLESNNGVHHIAALNRFFNDPSLFESLVATTDRKAREAQAKGACGGCWKRLAGLLPQRAASAGLHRPSA